MNHKKFNYIITSGWWCTNDANVVDRITKYGEEYIRSDKFHQLWSQAVNSFCNPEKVYIIDSNSQVKPKFTSQDEILISLHENAGHATMHKGILSGVSRAHLLGMSIALANDIDYWVYIEQDALIYGEGIIEKCISKMNSPYMFGSGDGTPQPVQHSLMIIRKDGIPKFIKNFTSIKAKDSEISPERKFAIATSLPLRILPEFLYIAADKPNVISKTISRVLNILYTLFQGFEDLPFGYGRQRPIDFNDSHFYFQHGTKHEIQKFMQLLDRQSSIT